MISPYLLRPLRSIEQAMRDIERDRLSNLGWTREVRNVDGGAQASEIADSPAALGPPTFGLRSDCEDR